MQFFRQFKLPLGLLMMLSLFIAVGGQWCALQGVAWVRMAISYSEKAPIIEALQKTFDGKHPCGLCHKIAKHQKSEKTDPAQVEFQIKLDPFFLIGVAAFIAHHITQTALLSSTSGTISYSNSPPTPPPREILFYS